MITHSFLAVSVTGRDTTALTVITVVLGLERQDETDKIQLDTEETQGKQLMRRDAGEAE